MAGSSLFWELPDRGDGALALGEGLNTKEGFKVGQNYTVANL